MSNPAESNDEGTEKNSRNRKKRMAITLQLVKKIRKSYEKNVNVKRIAEDEELSVPSVYKIINKICEGKRDEEIIGSGSGRRPQGASSVKSKISQILLRDSSYSQHEIVEELACNDIVRTQSGVSRMLKKMNYSRKRLVKIPVERNNPRNIDLRQVYARAINFIPVENLVFLDETGVNMHQSRNYGYSPINEKACKIVNANRGQNISCMVAIKKTGILGFKVIDGAFNGISFAEYIQTVLIPHFRLNQNDLLIMDNCRFHHRRDVLDLFDENNINYRFLPPYSPQLNPIEEYFSHFKSVLNSTHPFPRSRNELKDRIEFILRTESISFDGWYGKMLEYVEKAMVRQEFI